MAIQFSGEKKKMQASTYSSVKGSLGFGVLNHKRVLLGFGESGNKKSFGRRSLYMTDKTSCFGGISLSSVAMGGQFGCARRGFDGIFRSSVKPRSVRAQASGLSITIWIILVLSIDYYEMVSVIKFCNLKQVYIGSLLLFYPGCLSLTVCQFWHLISCIKVIFQWVLTVYHFNPEIMVNFWMDVSVNLETCGFLT